jgi:hypothetical protein
MRMQQALLQSARWLAGAMTLPWYLARCLKPVRMMTAWNCNFRISGMTASAELETDLCDPSRGKFALYGIYNSRLNLATNRDAVFRKSIA